MAVGIIAVATILAAIVEDQTLTLVTFDKNPTTGLRKWSVMNE